jgi:hypothetical protein
MYSHWYCVLEKYWLIYDYFKIIDETIAYCLYLYFHCHFCWLHSFMVILNCLYLSLHLSFLLAGFIIAIFNFVCWVSIIYGYSIPLTFFPYLNRIKKRKRKRKRKRKKKKERNKSISAKELFRIFEEAEGRLRLNMKQDFRKKI